MQASTDKGQTGPLGRIDTSLPQVFGRYLLVQRLSRGGMGEIFLAKHGLAGFEKLAVIKKVLPHLAADQSFISRFVDEAQDAIKLQHVNIAQVFEVGSVGNEYFLALEYVEGRDLRRTLSYLNQRKQRLPVDLALFVGRELANGLAYAHRRTSSDGASLNLVHCDISPPNVLVSFEGETKVIDFGIAKSALRGTATDPKMGFGKFGYMAPEQLIRGGMVDHRTDIYAAGVVLFELLTGQRLYEAGPEPDYRALAKKVAKGEHKMPSELDRALAPYDDLVATALRPKPEDRYQTAAEFRDAIQQCLVAVNPTISTDQLGAFMRELFSEEMTAQKELHERVAKAHLEDFQDQLTTQTGTTVSFALAALPIKPPELPGPINKPLPTPRPRPPTAQTDILQIPPQLSPAVQAQARAASAPAPTGATMELSLADGTGTMVPEDLSFSPAKPSRKPLVLVLALVLVLGVGLVWAIGRSGSDAIPPPAPVAQQETAPQQKITVEPIAEAPATAVTPAPAPAPVEQEPTLDPQPPPPPAPPIVHHDPHHVTHHEAKHTTTPPVVEKKQPELTRDAVAGKFKQVSREYEAYKAKNGGRLDQDWNDLATFIQFQLRADNLDDAARRIDSFRAKLRE